MTKKFFHIEIGKKFKYGGAKFVKTELTTYGPYRVNAQLDKAGAIGDWDRYFFAWDDEVEA